MDASWDAATAEGFVGIVARSDKGRFVGTRNLMISAPCVAVVEALALLYGCEFATSLGLHMIIVKSDSKEHFMFG